MATIEITTSLSLPTGSTIRALGLKPTGYPFERRVPATQRAHVKVPAGPVLIGVFDQQDQALALTRPINAPAGAYTRARLHKPSAAQLLVVLDRPPRKPYAGQHQSVLAVKTATMAHRPDVFLDAPGRMFGVWYVLDVSEAVLSLTSNELALGPVVPVILRPNAITTICECLDAKEASVQLRFIRKETEK